MLEYTYEEALDLLESNLNNARTKLVSELSLIATAVAVTEFSFSPLTGFPPQFLQAQQEEDLAHLKSQMVTVEVNMNRLVLHEVAAQEAAAAATAEEVSGVDVPYDRLLHCSLTLVRCASDPTEEDRVSF